MPTPTAATWVKFFTNADIPSPAAATYAHVFVENRIQMDMLMDLNKEYLREMGITTMGDIIAILRHAKKVADQSARERVLSVPESDPGVPVATVSATPNTGIVSSGRKAEKTATSSRTVSSAAPTTNVPKPRRVLPEHEGKYKVVLPTGSTPRSREILEKRDAKSASFGSDIPASRAGTKRSSIFDRLSDDIEPPAKFSASKIPKVDLVSTTMSSSIFARLGDKKSSDSVLEESATSSGGILKKQPGKPPFVAADVKYTPSEQKVILVKKIPAKAATVVSSDEEDLDEYPRLSSYGVDVGAGGGLKSVSFSEEDEVLEIAPRRVRVQGQSGSTQANRLRFNETEVSVKQRLGNGGGINGGKSAANRSPSLHGTKKVVHMKQKSSTGAGGKMSPVRASMKSDSMMQVRKQPIQNRLSLGSIVDKKPVGKRIERFSLDSKLGKGGKVSSKNNGSVFDRLGYNRK